MGSKGQGLIEANEISAHTQWGILTSGDSVIQNNRIHGNGCGIECMEGQSTLGVRLFI